jgi:hypothetical protein
MKTLLIFLGALAAYGQTVSLSDTLTNAVGGGSFTGRITVTLSAPGSAQPLYYSTTSLTGWQAVYCLGVTGSDCTTTTAAGVFAATLYANSTITPAGTSYSARFTPAKGSPWSEVWVITPSTTTLRQIRATTVPTPTTTFQASQLALASGSMVYGSSTGVGAALGIGSAGQVLTVSGGYPAWAAAAACATCVVTSGSYADPAWLTSLAGSKISGNISGNSGTATALAANGTNCSAGSFPLGVDASGNSETCTALPTTISGTANQITASASTGAVTLSLPATITGLTSVTSTGFTGALTGNASTATALASTVASGRLWIGQGTGAPTSDSLICADTTNHRLGVGTCSPATTLDVLAASGTSATLNLRNTTGTNNTYFYTSNSSGNVLFGQESSAGGSLYAGTLAYAGVFGHSGLYPLHLATNNTVRMTLAATTGNLLIGTTTDGNYKLDVASSGSSGTLRVYDQTATTGVTKAVVRAGAGQSSTNLMEWQNSAGTLLAGIDSAGGMYASNYYNIAGNLQIANNVLDLGSGFLFRFSSTAASSGTKDLSLSRSAAGVLQVGDGGANSNGTILAKIHTWSSGTEGTCSSTLRGQVVMVQGGAGVADTFRVCRKDAADAYAWTALY